MTTIVPKNPVTTKTPELPECNLTINDVDYYDPDASLDSLGSIIGAFSGTVSLLPLMILSSIIVSIMTALVYSNYKNTNQFTPTVIIMIILLLCSCSSTVQTSIDWIKYRNKLNEVPKNATKKCKKV